MAGILDYFDSPDMLGQLLGFGGGAPKPPTPPPPPPQVMANAPQSFAPNSSFDGGGLQPPNFNQRFAGGPEEPPTPMPPTLPPQRAQGGAFGGMGGKPVGWDSGAYDQPMTSGQGNPPPMQFAGAPQTRGGFPFEAPGGGAPRVSGSPEGLPQQADELVVNRTQRNARADGPDMSPAAAMRRRDEGTQSLDEMELDRRGGGPPPTNILPGGLAASLGAPTGQQPQRSRTLSNALMGLGKGLSTVGQLKPGTTGAASFAAGAGGALEGSGQHEDRGLDRDIKQKEHEAALALRGATLAENQRYHKDRVDVERDKMTARLNGTGAGQSGSIERLAKEIREEAGKDENGRYKMPLADAVSRARAAPTDRSDELRRERLALDAFKDDKKDGMGGTPQFTLDQWRKFYGLTGASSPPEGSTPPPKTPVPDTPASPSLWDRLFGGNSGATPPPQSPGAPLSRPVVPGTPVPPRPSPAPPADMGPMPGAAPAAPPQATPAKPPAAPPVGKTPPIPNYMGTPPVPGAKPFYSESRKSWAWVTPDGKRIPVAPQNAPNTQVPAIP